MCKIAFGSFIKCGSIFRLYNLFLDIISTTCFLHDLETLINILGLQNNNF